jgi:hypothetical protein
MSKHILVASVLLLWPAVSQAQEVCCAYNQVTRQCNDAQNSQTKSTDTYICYCNTGVDGVYVEIPGVYYTYDECVFGHACDRFDQPSPGQILPCYYHWKFGQQVAGCDD